MKESCKYRIKIKDELTGEIIQICEGKTLGAKLCDKRRTKIYRGKFVPVCEYSPKKEQNRKNVF